jgi:hypothetical protein
MDLYIVLSEWIKMESFPSPEVNFNSQSSHSLRSVPKSGQSMSEMHNYLPEGIAGPQVGGEL